MSMRRALLFALMAVMIILPAVPGFSIAVKSRFTLPAFDGMPLDPRICGDWVVAANYDSELRPNGSSLLTAKSIYAYNIKTGEARELFEGTAVRPHIGGGHAIWSANPTQITNFLTPNHMADGYLEPNDRKRSNLVLVLLETEKYLLPQLATGTGSSPSVWGNYVGWVGGGQVWLMELSSGEQWPITAGDQKKWGVHIGGNLVVWQQGDGNPGAGSIYGYDIQSGQVITIADESDCRWVWPKTDGKTVVWWKSRESGAWGYDVKSGRRFVISEKGTEPDVDNGVVVFRQSIKGGYAVFGKDLATGQEFRISEGMARSFPSISGNRVVWAGQDDKKIHCAELDKSATPKAIAE